MQSSYVLRHSQPTLSRGRFGVGELYCGGSASNRSSNLMDLVGVSKGFLASGLRRNDPVCALIGAEELTAFFWYEGDVKILSLNFLFGVDANRVPSPEGLPDADTV